MASSVPDRTNCSALIKSVTIENFKSFSAKTTVAPLTNFCAIVGPNGSGKSNFFDAICFALGEKPQNLRVSKLKVIY
ncbi:MAG: Structural maintenance of chromosomes protein 1B [Marteilia pararefringens]